MNMNGKRFFEKLKRDCNKGFTLIEMLIATALVALFFSMAVMVLPTWVQSYNEMITLSYARQIANGIIKAVESQVMFADNVAEVSGESGKIEGRGPDGDFVIPETGSAGETLIAGLVYDKQFYREMKTNVSCSVTAGEYCTVIVMVYDKNGNKILEKERSIKLVGRTA